MTKDIIKVCAKQALKQYVKEFEIAVRQHETRGSLMPDEARLIETYYKYKKQKLLLAIDKIEETK